MHKYLVLASLLTLTLNAPALAAQQPPPPGAPPPGAAPAAAPSSSPQPPPDPALTARFSNFLTQVLAGKMPSSNVSDEVKHGLTPQLLGQIRGSFASLGHFHRLEFVRQDSVQQYRQYHYRAVFDNGSQGVMFVVDSSGLIAGFFQDPSV
ncbi:MAG: hypothetical protein JO078_07695 [Candidatus Eremiobacteraeota bacterium]|nr:hypothetical protein [Candidatus Eremiobacteraeota bacterium]MBV9056595.1 hypothetical protein [Candidatus Eremiobacteraeota bacterium]MBV9699993.1 hypothetical protein [Candidatus Eremiobacteraeota bacterium]